MKSVSSIFVLFFSLCCFSQTHTTIKNDTIISLLEGTETITILQNDSSHIYNGQYQFTSKLHKKIVNDSIQLEQLNITGNYSKNNKDGVWKYHFSRFFIDDISVRRSRNLVFNHNFNGSEDEFLMNFKNGNYRIEEIEQEQSQSGGVSIVMSSGGSQAKIVRNDRNYVYTLYKKGEKTYYTVEKIVKPTITIDKKSVKKILNYECYKVLYKSAGETYEIWVTDALKLTASPMDGLNFGGTVLEINSKNLTYKAKKIEFVSQKDNLFDVSSEDKKITKEQAEDLQEQNIKDFERKAKK